MITRIGRRIFPELNRYLIANLISIIILISGEWFRVSRRSGFWMPKKSCLIPDFAGMTASYYLLLT